MWIPKGAALIRGNAVLNKIIEQKFYFKNFKEGTVLIGNSYI